MYERLFATGTSSYEFSYHVVFVKRDLQRGWSLFPATIRQATFLRSFRYYGNTFDFQSKRSNVVVYSYVFFQLVQSRSLCLSALSCVSEGLTRVGRAVGHQNRCRRCKASSPQKSYTFTLSTLHHALVAQPQGLDYSVGNSSHRLTLVGGFQRFLYWAYTLMD